MRNWDALVGSANIKETLDADGEKLHAAESKNRAMMEHMADVMIRELTGAEAHRIETWAITLKTSLNIMADYYGRRKLAEVLTAALAELKEKPE